MFWSSSGWKWKSVRGLSIYSRTQVITGCHWKLAGFSYWLPLSPWRRPEHLVETSARFITLLLQARNTRTVDFTFNSVLLWSEIKWGVLASFSRLLSTTHPFFSNYVCHYFKTSNCLAVLQLANYMLHLLSCLLYLLPRGFHTSNYQFIRQLRICEQI